MLNSQKDRLFDLLRKGAPLTFISKETGLSPSQIVTISNNEKTNNKTYKRQNRTRQLAHVRLSHKKVTGLHGEVRGRTEAPKGVSEVDKTNS